MQTELLDRWRWITRIELANAILEYPGNLSQPATTPQLARLAHPHRVRDRHTDSVA
jgi:hypothetical protein